MNAVGDFAEQLERSRIFVALGEKSRRELLEADTEVLRNRLVRRHRHSLAAFLNRVQRSDLNLLCAKYKENAKGTVGELRARLWIRGACMEAGGDKHLGSGYQPIPIVLGSRLVYQGPLHGLCPPCSEWPRPVPQVAVEPRPSRDPESLEELLANADSLLGVRMGAKGRDKGMFGTRIEALLGIEERGLAEADWRGEVEIKTVPVIRDRAGWWRVKEDPAISMEHVDPRIKLRKVLWVARVGGSGDSPILSWYFQEWDSKIAALATRFLHHRPKGPKSTSNKGWYLQKRFFLHSGFLTSLNG
ncbi:MAG: hypothetical protein GY811_14995 [Myxococcales bacterium]|nr:hypothetical protein [Myxococcales bacterium]